MKENVRASLIHWIDDFASCVRNRDVNAASQLFAPEVTAFGTRNGSLIGLDQLLELQWRPTWNATNGFFIKTDDLSAGASNDESLAWVSALWVSKVDDAAEIVRQGRASFILRQNAGWKCVHSHLSYTPSGDL